MTTASAENQLSSDPNDTQPLPTQVYQSYISTRCEAPIGLPNFDQPYGHLDSGPRTYVGGELGHVNLMGDCEDGNGHAQPDGAASDDDASEVEGQLRSQHRTDNVTSPVPFSPTTPAVAGQKHDRRGNAISSVGRTPATDLTAMFAEHNKKTSVGLSQVFRQTQAPSSPLPENLGSDNIFERPSPSAIQFAQTSPTSSLSSPPISSRNGVLRTHTDPQVMYVSTKDSQKRRQYKVLAEEKAATNLTFPRDEFEELFGEDNVAATKATTVAKENAGKRKMTPNSIRNQTSAIQYATRGRSYNGATKSIIGLTTPAIGTRARGRAVDLVSDNPTPALPRTNRNDQSDEDVFDEYDELSQGILSSEHAETELKGSADIIPQTSSKVPASAPDSQTRGLREDETARIADSQPPISEKEQETPTRQIGEQSRSASNHLSSPLQLPSPHHENIRGLLNSQRSSSIPLPPKLIDEMDDTSRVVQSDSEPAKQMAPGWKRKRNVSHKDGQESVSQPSPRKARRINENSRVEVLETSPIWPSHAKADLKAHGSGVEVLQSSEETSNRNKSTTNENSKQTSTSTGRFETAPSHQSSFHANQNNASVGQSSSETPVTKSRRLLMGVTTGLSQASNAGNLYEDVNVLDDADPISVDITSPAAGRNKLLRPKNKRAALIQDSKEADGLVPNLSDRSSDLLSEETNPSQHSKDLIQDPTKNLIIAQQRAVHSSPALAADIDPVLDQNTNAIQTTPKGLTSKRASLHNSKNKSLADISNVISTAEKVTGKDEPAVTEGFEQDRIEPSTRNDKGQSQFLFPNRVLARFTGLSLAFHPATCVNTSTTTSPGSYLVKFDDGTSLTAPRTLVRRFELRRGDIVRVDLENWRSQQFVVHGFKDTRQPHAGANETQPKTDVFGHETVVLRRRPRATPNGDKENATAEAEVFDVPITHIYLSSSMWKDFTDREYNHVQDKSTESSRFQTPLHTPTRNGGRESEPLQLALKPQRTEAGPLGQNKALFSNMVFAITYSQAKEFDRQRVERLILSNGGRVLSDGFEELFESLGEAKITTPSKRQVFGTSMPKLSTEFEHTGFAAVITDKHSRRKKFLQALALDVPCLAGRWILDSVAQNQALPWKQYLLPAGESSFLGTVHSRTFASEGHGRLLSESRLTATIDGRPRFFAGKSVILVLGSAKDSEKNQAHFFLTSALGASRVACTRDVPTAKKLLSEEDGSGGWDWVCVEEGKVTEAKKQLSSSGTAKSKGKRKSREAAALPVDAGSGQTVKVLSDEHVVQSLILGELLPLE